MCFIFRPYGIFGLTVFGLLAEYFTFSFLHFRPTGFDPTDQTPFDHLNTPLYSTKYLEPFGY